MTEQVRLSESPSRKMPDGGTILTVGATVGTEQQEGGEKIQMEPQYIDRNKSQRKRERENKRKVRKCQKGL